MNVDCTTLLSENKYFLDLPYEKYGIYLLFYLFFCESILCDRFKIIKKESYH